MQQFVFPIALQKQSIVCMSTLSMSCSCSNICEFDAVGVLIGQSSTVFLSKMLACQIFHNLLNFASIMTLSIMIKNYNIIHTINMNFFLPIDLAYVKNMIHVVDILHLFYTIIKYGLLLYLKLNPNRKSYYQKMFI